MEDEKIRLARQIAGDHLYFVEEISDEKVLGLLRELGYVWQEQVQAWVNANDGWVTVVQRIKNEW